jgi:hypothetical protein
MVSSFDTSRHLAVKCAQKTKSMRIYYVCLFLTFFEKKHNIESTGGNSFHPTKQFPKPRLICITSLINTDENIYLKTIKYNPTQKHYTCW